MAFRLSSWTMRVGVFSAFARSIYLTAHDNGVELEGVFLEAIRGSCLTGPVPKCCLYRVGHSIAEVL